MGNGYTNADGSLIRGGGGNVRVTLSSGVGQGNGGTSLICAGCHVQAMLGNDEQVYMAIGAAASADNGIGLGYTGEDAQSLQPLWVPIDDVSKLYFYSEDQDAKVNIQYYAGN